MAQVRSGMWSNVHSVMPVVPAVREVVEGLYDEEVRPHLGIVRARMEELGLGGGRGLEKEVVSAVCGSSWGWLDYSECEQNPVVVLRGRAARFVDPQGADVYSAETWQRWDAIFAELSRKCFEFPGSRYACAQALGQCSEFVSYTCGARLRIVQLCLKRGSLRYADRKGKRGRTSPPTIYAVDVTGRAIRGKEPAAEEPKTEAYPSLLPRASEPEKSSRAWIEDWEQKEGVVLDNRRTFLHIPESLPAAAFSKSLPSALFESDRSDADRAVLGVR